MIFTDFEARSRTQTGMHYHAYNLLIPAVGATVSSSAAGGLSPQTPGAACAIGSISGAYGIENPPLSAIPYGGCFEPVFGIIYVTEHEFLSMGDEEWGITPVHPDSGRTGVPEHGREILSCPEADTLTRLEGILACLRIGRLPIVPADLLRLARRAVEERKTRMGEDVTEWARRLAEDFGSLPP